MAATLASAQAAIPAHVPAHLVRNFSFDSTVGASEDPHRAADPIFEGPDIFFSPIGWKGGPGWIVTRVELLREIYQDPQTYSSNSDQFAPGELYAEADATGIGEWKLVPISMDPPEHTKYRVVINPIFSPTRIAQLEPGVRATCIDLVEAIHAAGECEFVEAFARPFPVTVFLRLMGLPLEKTADFVAWEEGLLHATSEEQAIAARLATGEYLKTVMADRRANPTDDLSSLLANAHFDGRPGSDEEVMGLYFLFFLAGLDTVTSALGFIFRELAQQPHLQQQLRDDPSLIPNAIEELMRAYTIVASHRWVTRDVEFHGVQFKRGDLILLGTQTSGRDAHEFPDPQTIDFKRDNVRHLAFASGPHRCIGSHLARREIKIALEQWLTRIPPFRVKPGETTRAVSDGAVWSVTYLPLVWG